VRMLYSPRVFAALPWISKAKNPATQEIFDGNQSRDQGIAESESAARRLDRLTDRLLNSV
jgi:hypothetical protein